MSFGCTMEPVLKGHCDERPIPLKGPLVNVNLNKCIDLDP